MNIEIVMQILADGRIRTDRGIRNTQGNSAIRAGDTVTVLGNVIIGWTRRAGSVPGIIPTANEIMFMVHAYYTDDTDSYELFTVDLTTKRLTRKVVAMPYEWLTRPISHCYVNGKDYILTENSEQNNYVIVELGSGLIIDVPVLSADQFNDVYFPYIQNVEGKMLLAARLKDGTYSYVYEYDFAAQSWSVAKSIYLDTSRGTAVSGIGSHLPQESDSGYTTFGTSMSNSSYWSATQNYPYDSQKPSYCRYGDSFWGQTRASIGEIPSDESTAWVRIAWVMPVTAGSAYFSIEIDENGTAHPADIRSLVIQNTATVTSTGASVVDSRVIIGKDGEIISEHSTIGSAEGRFDLYVGEVNKGSEIVESINGYYKPIFSTKDDWPLWCSVQRTFSKRCVGNNEVASIMGTPDTISRINAPFLYYVGTNMFSGELSDRNNGMPIYAVGTGVRMHKGESGATDGVITGDRTWFSATENSDNSIESYGDFHGHRVSISKWNDYQLYDRDSNSIDCGGSTLKRKPIYVSRDSVVWEDRENYSIGIDDKILAEEIYGVYTTGEMKK